MVTLRYNNCSLGTQLTSGHLPYSMISWKHLIKWRSRKRVAKLLKRTKMRAGMAITRSVLSASLEGVFELCSEELSWAVVPLVSVTVRVCLSLVVFLIVLGVMVGVYTCCVS